MKKNYVFKNEWIKVRIDEIEEDGEKSSYTVLERIDSVVIVPLSSSGKTVLISEFRYPINSNCWGLPMGFIDDGETSFGAAERELREEANISGDLIEIGMFNPAPGLTAQKVKVYLCKVSDEVLENSFVSKDEKNLNKIQVFDFKTIYGMIKSGKITDGFTLSALQLVGSYLK